MKKLNNKEKTKQIKIKVKDVLLRSNSSSKSLEYFDDFLNCIPDSFWDDIKKKVTEYEELFSKEENKLDFLCNMINACSYYTNEKNQNFIVPFLLTEGLLGKHHEIFTEYIKMIDENIPFSESVQYQSYLRSAFH